MAQSIRIIMMDKIKNVAVPGNYIHESTIRHAFQLQPDSVVELTFKSNGIDINCLTNEAGTTFILPENWSIMEFSAKSDRAPSRPPTAPTMHERPPTPFELENQNRIITSIKSSWKSRVFRIVGDKLTGTCVLIKDRHVLTAAHLSFKLDEKYTIKGAGNQEIFVKCVFIRKHLDFAILQSDDLPILEVPIGSLVPGSKYFMMGYQNGVDPSNPTITKGIIKGFMDDLVHLVGTPGWKRGYSGAPVFNHSGRLAGLLLRGTCGFSVNAIRAIVPFVPSCQSAIQEYVDSSEEQKYARILGIGYIINRHSQGNSDNES